MKNGFHTAPQDFTFVQNIKRRGDCMKDANKVTIKVFKDDAEWLKKWALKDKRSIAHTVQEIVDVAKPHFEEEEVKAEVVK